MIAEYTTDVMGKELTVVCEFDYEAEEPAVVCSDPADCYAPVSESFDIIKLTLYDGDDSFDATELIGLVKNQVIQELKDLRDR